MAKEETVRLNVKVISGSKEYEPGQPVPLTKDFTAVDVARIEAIHGAFNGGPAAPAEDARDEARLAAKDGEIAKLRAVIAAYEKADAASIDAARQDATDEQKKALADAVAEIETARKAAKL